MPADVLIIDPDTLFDAPPPHPRDEVRDLWVMQNELCMTMANKHDPMAGVDLSEALIVSLGQLERLQNHYTELLPTLAPVLEFRE